MSAEALDCRGKPFADAGRAIIARYNALPPGERFDATVDEYGAGLRVWLLEAGARHTARMEDGTWRLSIERRASPAQGSISGLHHLVARDGWIWACERAQRVARFDEEGTCIASRAVARKASHLAVAAGRVFVADAEGNEIIALDAGSLAPIARWSAPGGPQLPLAGDEGVVCVTGGGAGTLTIAWPQNGGYRSRTIEVGHAPHDPCFDREQRHVFVPCAGDGMIVKVRVADGEIVGRTAVGDGPSHLALHPDGTRVYSANSWDGTVTCISVDGERCAQAASGGWAHAIDIAPDGRYVYVGNFLDDTVAVFDAQTLERVALLSTEPYAHGVDVSPDGRYLVASGFCSDHVRIFDARQWRELARLEVGRGSSHAAFARDGSAWIACSVSDHLARIDLGSMRRIGGAELSP